jgi:hypothetical protein
MWARILPRRVPPNVWLTSRSSRKKSSSVVAGDVPWGSATSSAQYIEIAAGGVAVSTTRA